MENQIPQGPPDRNITPQPLPNPPPSELDRPTGAVSAPPVQSQPAVAPVHQAPADLASQIYPTASASNLPGTPLGAPKPPPPAAPANEVIDTPFDHMFSALAKFAKTNLLLYSVYTIVLIIIGFIAVRLVCAGMITAAQTTSNDDGYGALGVLIIALYIIALIISFLSMILGLLGSKLMLEGVRGHHLKISESLAPLKKIWVLIVYSLILFVIEYVYNLIFSHFGSLYQLFNYIYLGITIFLYVRWSFTYFAIVDYPDSGPFNSLRRSTDLTSGHRWSIFFYWFFVFLLFFIGGFLLQRGIIPTYIFAGAVGLVVLIVISIFYVGFAGFYNRIREVADPPGDVTDNLMLPQQPQQPVPHNPTPISPVPPSGPITSA